MKTVLDTNAVLYLLGGKLAKPLPPGGYAVSVITEMELLSYPNLDNAALSQIKSFLSNIGVVSLTPEVREQAIRPRRRHNLNLPDSIVAATALTLHAKLITNDAKLLRVPGLSSEPMDLK